MTTPDGHDGGPFRLRDHLGALRAGAAAVAPVIIGAFPFGLVIGVTIATTRVGDAAGLLSAPLVFAGTGQLVLVQVLGGGGVWWVAAATALIVNTRFLVYSASLGPYLAELPPAWRWALPYLLTDGAYAVSAVRFAREDLPWTDRLAYYLGAGATLWPPWMVANLAGYSIGARIPSSWGLAFAAPLTFLALLVPAVGESRPGLVAALVGGAVATAGVRLPYGLGLVAGAVAGIAAGVLAEGRSGS